ncbi:G-patch domain and KOW motifs-containing protein [Pieris brassicae]|uniref:G-patch domain and KOW motifs-containing protein n=1 Tax=Pieris brassicae TaxID=7116 RepID=UPI001E660951|nr:G-patch domain and KOW motifs-containing protein [Pieris brassicae]
MEPKKISFGFMKTKKQDKPIVAEKKDYIECVEEKSIKVVGGEIEDRAPLVIQMKPNTLITAERLNQIAAKVENFEDENPEVDNTQTISPENETLDQMAARELLEEAKKIEVVDASTLVVPIPAQPILEGKKESTLDDYESIPIQDFGIAMLRGMGWTPGKELSKYKLPQLRPKGLGLGADKVVKENQKKSTRENDEDLAIVKKAFVKITMGKYAGFYGQVVSLDEENGRAMVDISIKKETVSLSEFMMQPVSKSDYDKQSKVINADSYEKYKKMENNPNSRKNVEKESRQKYVSDRNHDKEESNSSRDKRKSSKKYSSNEDSLEFDRAKRESPSHARNEKGKPSKERTDRYHDEEKRKKPSRKYSSSESLHSSEHEDRGRRSPSRGCKYRREKEIKNSKERRNKDIDRRNKSKYSSNESLNTSESDYKGRSSSSEPRRHKKSSKTSKDKKDIDKKRKGKKKKRDRDRSPNYKKCRK